MENETLKSKAPMPGQQIAPGAEEEQGQAIGEIVAVVMEYRWLIAAITALSILLGGAFIFVSKPVYKADGLLQIEEKGSGGGMSAALKDLQPLMGDSTTVSAEQEILASRMVLGRVINRLKLDIEVEPKTFPLIGAAIARRYKGDEPNSPLFGMSSYAWGGEILQVDALEVARSAEDKALTLVAGENGSFELFDENGGLVLSGVVGTRASAGKFSVFVSKLVARPGTRFVVIRRSTETAVELLRKNFTVKEKGKKSGILEASLIGPEQEKNSVILDDILKTYVRQNVERRSAEAENTLKFLETQLPALKREMDSAEAAYNAYRQSRGSLDLNIETQSVLQSLVEVDNQIVALRQERDELRQSFTPEHPRVQAVDQRLERLKDRRRQFDSDVNKLPDTQQKVLRLARDVEVSTTLYTDLLNTAQQLKVSKAGTVGDVRIIDAAVASKRPVGLPAPVVLAIATFLGLLVSMIATWVIRSLRVVVEDPETIESELGLPVYATIPHSPEEVAIVRRSKGARGAGELLAIRSPEDDAIESLRGLRTTIHFALLDASHNSLLITGSSPGLGKSFISKNLGAVLANSGQRIVIIDADLRKGHINKEFGLRRETGVSEYVAGAVKIEDIVKPTSVPNLWVVTTGQIPPNPSELLMHERFEELLQKLGQQFDTLIVDAPPILAVSDAAIIGRMTGATLMVARAGRHPLAELEQAIKRLNHAGVQVKGFVFNDLNTNRQRYRYGYKGYVYRYSYSKSA
ncbi:MAG: polysaccharide biosynthesis tyrosine autokinase [Zoogloea sp.]|uniref:polysaccharide biosynthesis tyrosine autokinase n=1 Tax=Zoogloea sp. TaxID=49181 RepID=UPI0026094500|nr:polysaccharide biosynthesis tyrosine autokinase [Zoogloea sp.]MDD3326646.1 polysaccharide biosynthesis tyrosine autokinase [Zoogloea sp.]